MQIYEATVAVLYRSYAVFRYVKLIISFQQYTVEELKYKLELAEQNSKKIAKNLADVKSVAATDSKNLKETLERLSEMDKRFKDAMDTAKSKIEILEQIIDGNSRTQTNQGTFFQYWLLWH